MTDVLEQLELEATIDDAPICEDDHIWYQDEMPNFPPCAVIATHLLRVTCTGDRILVCTPLAEWLTNEDPAACSVHTLTEHLVVIPI